MFNFSPRNRNGEPSGRQQETQSVQAADVQKRSWIDLSHDTDVNYLPNTRRANRVEREDVELLVGDRYVPLNEIPQNPPQYSELETPYYSFYRLNRAPYRRKREIINSVAKEHKGRDLDQLEELKIGAGNVVGPFDDKLERVREPVEENLERNKDVDELMQRSERQAGQRLDDSRFGTVKADRVPIVIEGLRIEDSDKEPKIIDEGIPSVLADSRVTLRYDCSFHKFADSF